MKGEEKGVQACLKRKSGRRKPVEAQAVVIREADYDFPVRSLTSQGSCGTGDVGVSGIVERDPVDVLVRQARKELREGKTREWRAFARKVRTPKNP